MNKLKSKIKSIISYILHGEPDLYLANIVKLHPNQLLDGRCALITGGTSGIGFSIAEAFLNAGAVVFITGRNSQRIEHSVKKLAAIGTVFGIEMDNTKVSSIENGFSSVLTQLLRF